jgi:hypothetical protein
MSVPNASTNLYDDLSSTPSDPATDFVENDAQRYLNMLELLIIVACLLLIIGMKVGIYYKIYLKIY